jgi:hypothetical protein
MDGTHGWAAEIEVLSDCGYAITPAAVSIGPEGGSRTITVSAEPDCHWSALSHDGWVAVSGPADGVGSGSVDLQVATNPVGAGRTGAVSIAGRVLMIEQEASACPVEVSTSALVIPAAGGAGSIEVSTPSGCAWTASSNVAWMGVVGGAGTGPGVLDYVVDPSALVEGRLGILTIGGASVRVTQNGLGCTFGVTVSEQTFGSSGGSGVAGVATTAGCSWTVESAEDWIVPEAAEGSGSGLVTFSVRANTSGGPRTGGLLVAGESLVIDQPCVDPLLDGGLEQGTPSPAWIESSTTFGSPLCNPGDCGLDGARSGQWWAWLGGVEGSPEQASLEQEVVVPASPAALSLHLWIPSSSGNGVDEVRVLVDGVEVWSALADDPAYLLGYMHVMVPLPASASGGVHSLRLEASTTGVPTASSFFVDDISVETCWDESMLLVDGFESGGTHAWSRQVPEQVAQASRRGHHAPAAGALRHVRPPVAPRARQVRPVLW